MRPRSISQHCLPALLLLLLSCGIAHARGPATPEEKQKYIALSHKLETDPLGPTAAEDRKWALTFVFDVPGLGLKVCTAFLAPLLKSDMKYSKEINLQNVISSAAFMFANPDKVQDQDAVYLAGLLGSLRTYDSLLKQHPDAKLKFLDELLEKRDKGELEKYVQKKKREGTK